MGVTLIMDKTQSPEKTIFDHAYTTDELYHIRLYQVDLPTGWNKNYIS